MNELELRAYGRVAQAIARHAYAMAAAEDKDNCNGRPDTPRPIYYHLAMSTFEAVASDLWRLHIFKPLDERGGWAHHFVFDCTIDEANVVAERNACSGPTLSELLVTFINLFADFGAEYWGFSSKPGIPFGTKSRIAPALDALVTIGYLTRTDDGYVWTESIRPIMLASYFDDGWKA